MLNLGLAFGGHSTNGRGNKGASAAMMSECNLAPMSIRGVCTRHHLLLLSIMKKNGNTRDLIIDEPLVLLADGRRAWECFGSEALSATASPPSNSETLDRSIGWPLFMSSVVIASMLAGMLTGEWSRAGAGPIRIMSAGVVCLVAAMDCLPLPVR